MLLVFQNISFSKPVIAKNSCRKEKLLKNGDLSATPPHLLKFSLRAILASKGRQVQVDFSQKVDGQSTLRFLVLCSVKIAVMEKMSLLPIVVCVLCINGSRFIHQ